MESHPDRWEADVALNDGGVVHLRPIRPDDAERLVDFHRRQSPESTYYRYFTPKPTLTADEVRGMVTIDQRDNMALVALLEDEIIGVGRYDRLRGSDEAEVAFQVDDAHRGRGLATVFLEYLVVAAREAGLAGLSAQVLPDNRRMLTVLDRGGFDAHRQFAEGVIEVELGLDPSRDALAAIEGRERRAEARSVARLLRPAAVAVIAGTGPLGDQARATYAGLVEHDFAGPVVRVGGPGAWSEEAYPRIEDVPEAVDLAVIGLAPDALPTTLEACARKGVRGAILLGATGEAPGDLVATARRSGLRLVGPGALGLVNTASDVRLHATPVPVAVPRGPIGFLSQSGSLARALVDRAVADGLGFSSIVAVGDKADVSANDLLQYWEGDPETEVIALYLESFGNPRKFSRIARRVSREKPIVAVKSGRAPVVGDGAEWPDDMLDALMSQTGVIRVDTTEELLDVARVLATQPVPGGGGVAIVGNAEGPVLLAADACLGVGLEVVRAVVLDRDDDREAFAAALTAALDGEADAALVIRAEVGPGGDTELLATAEAVGAAAGKTVVATVVGGTPTTGPVPLFAFPERAARALGRVTAYGRWRARPAGATPVLDGVDADAARAVVACVLASSPSGRVLEVAEAEALLGAFGIASPRQRVVGSAEEAAAAVEELGMPVSLKALGLAGLGKTEARGLALDLNGEDDVLAAYGRMADHLGGAMHPALVQRMVEPGADVLVALHQHPRWGSTISVGVGGAVAAALDDGVQRVVPLTDLDARRLVDASPAARLLAAGEADRALLEDLLLRLSALADAVPEVAMARLNPVIVTTSAAWAAGALVRVRPWAPGPEPDVRRL